MCSQDDKLADDAKASRFSGGPLADLVELEIEDFTKTDGIAAKPVQHSEKHDEALDLLQSNGQNITYITAQQDVEILRKIDRNIMPIMFAIYLLQFMDKQTISLSSVFGLSSETDLVGNDYSVLGSVLYIAQLICQPLSAYLLVKFRLSIYVPVIVTCWGMTLTCMAAARNFSGLLVSRFFLGGLEASIQGAFILTAQTWYRRHEQGARLAIWYSNVGLSNIFGTLIMFGIGHIKSSSLYSYQIVSLILGGITVTVGLLSFSLFPDNPVRSKFLTKEEKLLAIERIRANQQGLEVKVFKIKQVYEMILDVKSWCWMFLALLASIPGGGISTFGPLIIRGFGFNGGIVMLLLIPYGVLQLLWLALAFWANKRFNTKWPILVLCTIPCLVATIILLCVGRSKGDQPLLLFAYYLLSPFNVTIPTIINWQSSNVAGHTKKSATSAFMVMGIISGNIIGPLLFNSKDKPYYHRGLVTMIICFALYTFITFGTVLYLRHLNEWNRTRRIARGKAGKIVDYSMLTVTAAEEDHARDIHPNTGKHAFDDLTDIQNDEFIYVY